MVSVYSLVFSVQVICKVAKGTKDDVDAAVEAAHVSLLTVNLFNCLIEYLSKLKRHFTMNKLAQEA